MSENTTRRRVLQGIGAAGVAATAIGLGVTTLSDSAKGVTGTNDDQARVWTTVRSSETDGSSNNPVEGNVGIAIGDALSHVGAFTTGTSSGDPYLDVPENLDTIEDLYTYFRDWLSNNKSDSAISKHSNLLVVREDRFGDRFDAPFHAEYEGNVAVSLGAEAVAWEFAEFSPTRAGSGRGHYWLQQCIAATGVNYGVVDGHGAVYQNSNVGSGDIATPAAPVDDDNNLCGSSSTVVSEPDTYDTYYWDNCAGSQIRSYFGV